MKDIVRRGPLTLVHDAGPVAKRPRRRPPPLPSAVDEPDRLAPPLRDAEAASSLWPTVFFATGSLAFFLALGIDAPVALALGIAAPFALVALLAPLWARRSTRRFDVDHVSLLSRGAKGALSRRLGRAWGMRLFASRDVLAERRGRVAMSLGDHRGARRAYAVALSAWRDEDRAPLSLRLGYAHACYALEDDLEACWVYGRLLDELGELPRVPTCFAHSLHRRGADAAQVAVAIARAEASGPDPEERAVLALLRAHLACAAGQKTAARQALRRPASHHGPRARALADALRARLGLATGDVAEVVSLSRWRR